MSPRRRRLLVAAGLAAALALAGPWQPAAADGPLTSGDLTSLRTQVARLAGAAQQAQQAALQAASRDAVMRRDVDAAAERSAQAQAQVDAAVRQAYISGMNDPVQRLLSGPLPQEIQLAAISEGRQIGDAAGALARAESGMAALRREREQASQSREQVLAAARAAYAAQDAARVALATAEARYAEQLAAAEAARASAKAAEDQARAQAQADRLRASMTQLAAERTALDTASADLAVAVTPAVTARGRGAQGAEAPLIALAAAAGSGYPQGFRPTGRVLTGEASWYGPGFVGSPTASGAPYNPELMTAAMLAVPLGTMVRLTANGRSVSVVVNDRGPYAKGRVLDCSRACSRLLGYDGTAQMTIEVLTRG